MSLPTPPSAYLLLRELPHLAQIWTGRWRKPRVPEGVDKTTPKPPVMIIPGLMSNDASAALLRSTLSVSGHPAYGAKLGLLTGVRTDLFERAEAQLAKINSRHEEKVVLIGWSLGGLYSRVLAQRHPERVAMVMTLGSPFSGSRTANNAWRVYNALNDHSVEEPPLTDDPSIKPPMHTVAVWSKSDGVIAPECARGTPSERDVEIEIETRHFKFASDRHSIDRVIQILGEQLSCVS